MTYADLCELVLTRTLGGVYLTSALEEGDLANLRTAAEVAGKRVQYFNGKHSFPKFERRKGVISAGADVWILEDATDPYWSNEAKFVVELILHLHKVGGILIMQTSAKYPLEEYLKCALVTDRELRERTLRRANELFAVKPLPVFKPNGQTPEYSHEPTVANQINEIIKGIPHFRSPKFLYFLQKNYPRLSVPAKGAFSYLDLGYLSYAEVAQLQMDLRFYRDYPQLDPENVFCSFANYQQVEPIHGARLIDVQALLGGSKQGVTLCGQAGGGKTHLAISLAKAWKEANPFGQVVFCRPETVGAHMKPYGIHVQQNQLWILDDFNAPFSSPSNRFLTTFLMLAHERGANVLVTSNTDFKDTVDSICLVHPVQETKERLRAAYEALFVPSKPAIVNQLQLARDGVERTSVASTALIPWQDPKHLLKFNR